MADSDYDQFLATLEEEDPEVAEAEEHAEEEDETALKLARRAQREAEAIRDEYRADKLVDDFNKVANETAKTLFEIYRKKDMDETQLKAAMQLAMTKAQEAAPKPEDVEARAAEMAQEAYGAGPITPGVSTEETPEMVYDALRERLQNGDMHAGYLMFEGLPSNGEVSRGD
jgi:vacuolar-type H+-ATPase catalytic subunit A/Vma1